MSGLPCAEVVLMKEHSKLLSCGMFLSSLLCSEIFRYSHKKRNGAPFTPEELSSCLKNEAPGSPDLSILSFEGAFHGRALGSLSCTHSKPVHKVSFLLFRTPSSHSSCLVLSSFNFCLVRFPCFQMANCSISKT